MPADATPRPMERGIVAVACRIGPLTISMPAPARHHDCLREIRALGLDPLGADQGFLDHRGLFLSRRVAGIVAAQHGQVTASYFHEGARDLFSEDLW